MVSKRENKIDFLMLEKVLKEVFSNNGIAKDPYFKGYYLMDEPCHKGK